MSEDDEGGFTYEVSPPMLLRFAASSLAQRLQWLDEMRTFSWEMASPETRSRWRNAREPGRWQITSPPSDASDPSKP